MESHTALTIAFGVCFAATAMIALPLSFIGYIVASITVVVHYLFAQWLIRYVEERRRQWIGYILFDSVCIISAAIWTTISHWKHGMNDQTEASLGFFIPCVLGTQVMLFLHIYTKSYDRI